MPGSLLPVRIALTFIDLLDCEHVEAHPLLRLLIIDSLARTLTIVVHGLMSSTSEWAGKYAIITRLTLTVYAIDAMDTYVTPFHISTTPRVMVQ